jgi:hypothetical protein
MLSQESSLQRVPHTMLSPSSSRAAPQTTPAAHALAAGFSTPPETRWLPQLIVRLQAFAEGYFFPALAVTK